MGEISMFVKDVVVQNQVGLHARPATFFIQKANEFKSSIWVEKEESKRKEPSWNPFTWHRRRHNYQDHCGRSR